MKAAVLYGAKDLKLEELQVPTPGEGESLIRIRAAGICGSDLHYYSKGSSGPFKPVKSFVLGHEFAGSVESPGGEGFGEGDRVVVEPGIPCFRCFYCRRGRYNLCSNLKFIGTAASIPHIDGGFAEYCKVPAVSLHKVPDGLGFEEAALAEPLSVAIHACRRGGIDAGEKALILGAGPIGLLTASMAILRGSIEPIVVDLVERRLRVASDIGARAVTLGQDTADEVIELTGGEGADIVFEASGSPSAIPVALKAVRKGGRVVLIGNLPDENLTARLVSIATKELDVRGVFRYANTFDVAIDLLSRKLVPISKMITHRFAIGDIRKAFDIALSGDALKVLIIP
jgi:2-desacetyl-2-hydroxyethyl bacteriochlorophyllide A dehydrogenase